jgi:hypothetical protein
MQVLLEGSIESFAPAYHAVAIDAKQNRPGCNGGNATRIWLALYVSVINLSVKQG